MRSSRRRRDHLIGDAEVADGTVQVTDIAAGFKGSVKAGDLTNLLRDAYGRRLPHATWDPA